ncbi:MAG TPA: hypothetical protein DCE14_03325 [Kosmotogaceae bacterium]|nr:hypothetical protein [Kosmotogaceae bacterium]
MNHSISSWLRRGLPLFWIHGGREQAVEFYTAALEVEVEDMPGELTGFRQTANQGLQFPLYIDSAGEIGRQ